ncbi:ShlB/FhaC/HecB family hemolysin secretion/activation protein [Commensalibacter papalotli (ex Botero et al. 2024)]|uniref:Hemolysin activation/secretion protein (FhaC) (PDB:2MHJ) n=1 Tax=Commensalibacter papalotli (ex Botero et al. 2024) TaxID=2972766 RepID=A0ABN8WB95_9PROT|nr:Hemolysin activation/secretion protein (FhaC) (PDB:2MHJ) [Commensalibacter papalotli (ex Botero et al. 2024)]CAI3951414.1 Hemolysin activation/secretion protein (FhaC) (PDB:2MHJ) [Commensalibacter papalotli (ex Botero et al. 2024)]
MWSVEYDHSLNGRPSDGHNSFFTAEGSIPLGPWTFFGGWYRYDDVYNLNYDWQGKARFDFTQKDFHIGASRVVARNSIGITTLQATYELKSFNSYLNYSRIDAQSATLSSLNFNASESMRV